MTERMPTRADLIERIRTSSKDAVVLQEMQRLGFWPQGEAQPTLEAALIEREAEVTQALQGLQERLRVIQNPEAALQAMRKQRMQESLIRREAAAQLREQRRHERALRWHEARKTQVPYLGAGVSGGLSLPTAQAPARALQAGLPSLDTPMALAQAMGLTLPELKFLTFHREVARTHHYRRFLLPKKTGGHRTISAPMPRLKRAQYWVLDNVLAQVPCHAAAHGFLPGRSILTNAKPHVGQDVVINLDIQNFFPTITFPRIKGVFQGLGYPEPVATMLALLCSENPCDELVVDGEAFFVGGKGRDRVLPQGAPTSPMLTNVLCRRMDRRLQGLAHKLGFTYTRYADDLTFSGSGEAAALVGKLLRQVRHVLKDEGFTPHPAKQHVMRAGARQQVTGVVVNDQPSVSRQERRKLRAALHRARHQGMEAATWHDQPATREVLLGYSRFVAMVDAAQGAPLIAQAMRLPGPAAPPRSGDAAAFRTKSAEGQAPQLKRGSWWQPAERPAPVLQLTDAQRKDARRDKRAAALGQPSPAAVGGAPSRAAVASAGLAGTPVPGATGGASAASARGAADAAHPANATKLPPPPWAQYGFQSSLLLFLWIAGVSSFVVVGGFAHMAFRFKKREGGWNGFWTGLGVLLLIQWLVRALT
ncbi:reverse transcriptase domain-containing protein [Roseateles terrae]|uniref:RNA-directed DNA polymerase n=1 Tax=Roseateles terrae TaxID=431060 RepID=A0ABR6GLS9_9BURK|nr:reverse transcriptase domain-containing protein [Roseateles terrae]MBB3193067.1 hypothetical protein [Roseateles terrae]OWQ89693.1 hypothetical protein CDN98_04035 [Roseateles terrae]